MYRILHLEKKKFFHSLSYTMDSNIVTDNKIPLGVMILKKKWFNKTLLKTKLCQSYEVFTKGRM